MAYKSPRAVKAGYSPVVVQPRSADVARVEPAATSAVPLLMNAAPANGNLAYAFEAAKRASRQVAEKTREIVRENPALAAGVAAAAGAVVVAASLSLRT